MTTGQLIKAARKKAGLTQLELAKRLNIPFQSVSQWERDLRNPKHDTIKNIAVALGVDWMELYADRDQATKDYVKNRFDEAEAWKARLDEIGEDMAKLNNEGQQEAVKRVKELTEIKKYQRPRQQSPFSAGIKVYGDGPAGSFPPQPQPAPQSPPAPAEGVDTTPPENATETPPEGE